jgi:DHA1 family bicyclomycin/chloramphenicol resistance-like MFS transporter
MNQYNNLPKSFIITLAMLTSISPLAIDVYLPSFTAMSEYFYTSIDQIEVTLSIYLLGFGIGQLIGGPLSDKYGRKIFIFIGLIIYTIFSFSISTISSIEQLWICRFLQAIGGGFAVVNTNAIVRDLYDGKEAAKVFSIISMIMLIAPMIAPIIGTSILYVASWQYIFIFLATYSLLLMYLISKLPETSAKIKSSSLFTNYIKILSNKSAFLLILAGGFGISGLFVFITKASFIYMEYYDMESIYFSLIFSLNAISIMLMTKLNIRLLDKYSVSTLLRAGISLQLCVAIFMYLVSDFYNIYIVIFGFVLFISSLGFIFANVMTLLLEDFKSISASCVAINGVFGFVISAFMGFLASYLHDGSIERVFLILIISSSISFFILQKLRK